MINTVVFDLDGVLIDAKPFHFQALNKALPEPYRISDEEHATVYDGLPTRRKLNLLTMDKGLPPDTHQQIFDLKQTYFDEYLDRLGEDTQKVLLFNHLRGHGLKIYVASNSIRHTVETALRRMGLHHFVSGILSNEDVRNPKPHPEMYLKAILDAGSAPDQTLIVEDSPVGLRAAYRSGAHVLRVEDPSDVTLEKILAAVKKAKPRPVVWVDERLNILVPMAGTGLRFAQAGFTLPKPLIPVNGTPMIQLAVDSVRMQGKLTFIVRSSAYDACAFLRGVYPGCNLVPVDYLTEGAACTTLLAEEYINNDNPLLIVNSDQYVDYDACGFMYAMKDVDGGILTFKANETKWSYAKVENGLVTRVAEKEVISEHATVGVYYWKRGSDYVKFAKQMIEKNIRVNNEFYVCPVFNQAIEAGLRFKVYPVQTMLGLGTPEDYHKNSRFLA